MKKFLSNKKISSYLGLFFVVIIWGIAPIFTYELNKYYSPTFKVAVSELILIPTYLIMSAKHIKDFNIDYIKAGIPTGFFLALANISQKMGLLYTTPAKYAFLENLSCITVPVLMFFLAKKKPTLLTFLSVFLCLAGVFILNGVSFSDGWGIGEILCALSGLLYGFNIAGTACFAKKLHAPLYLATQSVVGFSVSLIFSVLLNFIPTSSGTVIEKIIFPLNIELFAFLVIVTIVSSALCWTIRTNCMKHIPATAVAVIMPFSAVITSIASIIMGTDTLTANIFWGGILGVVAIILSSFDN